MKNNLDNLTGKEILKGFIPGIGLINSLGNMFKYSKEFSSDLGNPLQDILAFSLVSQFITIPLSWISLRAIYEISNIEPYLEKVFWPYLF